MKKSFLFFLFFLILNSITYSATLIVDDNSQCPGATYTSISNAINNATSGDTIEICAGTYNETITLTTSNITFTSGSDVTQPSDVEWANTHTYSLQLSNAIQIKIENIKIKTNSGYGINIELVQV
jgi:hypothetical protein